MKQIVIKIKFLFFFSCFLTQNSFSQISEGGIPYSFKVELDAPELQTFEIQKPNLDKLFQEMSQGIQTNRIAFPIDTDLSLENSGQWYNLPNEDRLWRLKINSKDALGLYLIYNKFQLGKGAKLFIYDEEESRVLGAFTSKNNKDGGEFSTAPINRETVILELFEPHNANSKLSIKQVGYMFKKIPYINQNNTSEILKKYNSTPFGSSLSCHININCTQGTGWEDQRDATVGILFASGGWCTGTLMNNTLEDQTPYVLTAFHCQEGETATSLSNAQFWFNYQSSGCTNGLEPTPQVLTGCTEKTKAMASDFALYELNNSVPTTHNPYFAGWDRSNTAASSGVGIHHPDGDIKKISVVSSNPITSESGTIFVGGLSYPGQNFWTFSWNQGGLQGGSSGSAFFNQDGRVVGQLLGGSGECQPAPINNNIYGKISASWINGSNGGLQAFLDPTNSGVTTLNGFNGTITALNNVRVRAINVNTSPCLFTNSTPVEVTVQNFGQNNQTDIPVEYELFDGSGTLLSQGQTIAMGTFTTSQTGTVTFNVDMEVRREYTIVARTTLVGDENPSDNERTRSFENIKPTIGASNIQITGADEMEGFTVSWTRGNGENSIVLVKEGSDFTPSDLPIDGDSYVANSTFPIGDPAGDAIVVYKGDANTVTVSNLDKNEVYYVAVIEFSCIPEDYLLEEVEYNSETVTNLETELANKIDIYPNPASDNITIDFKRDFTMAKLQFSNTAGKVVKETIIKKQDKPNVIELKDLSSGMYILNITVDNRSYQKKIFIK